MGPSRGAREEVEEFDNYYDPSVYQPKSSHKRPAGKKPAVTVKRVKTAPRTKPVKRVKPAAIVASIDFGTT